MNAKFCLVVIAILISTPALLAGSVQAGIINGSFESGDLTGWTETLTGGTANVLASADGRLATHGLDFLRLQAESHGVADPPGSSGRHTHSLEQTFAVGADGVLSFDYYFIANRVGEEFGMVTSAQVSISRPGFGWTTVNVGATTAAGWTPVTQQLDLAANYTVVITVNTRSLSANTILAESILGVDNLRINTPSIPEPSTFALAAIGLLGIALRRSDENRATGSRTRSNIFAF